MAPILKKDARSFGGAKPAPQCGYSKKEERLNFLTHFWAALVFAPIAAFLTLKALNGFGFGFKTLSGAAFAFFAMAIAACEAALALAVVVQFYKIRRSVSSDDADTLGD